MSFDKVQVASFITDVIIAYETLEVANQKSSTPSSPATQENTKPRSHLGTARLHRVTESSRRIVKVIIIDM